MDPNDTLVIILRLARGFIDADHDPNTSGHGYSDALELAERVTELDEWLHKGGFMPARWCRGQDTTQRAA